MLKNYFCGMFGELFIKGGIIGFMVSLPLGPIALLVIQRTVNKNRLSGLLSGFGAALSDTFYAIIAGFSLTYIIDFLKQHQVVFQVLGAVVMILLGLHIFYKNPVKEVRRYRRKGTNYVQDFFFSFLITFSNPLVIFIFLAVLTGSGVVLSVSEPYHSFFIILGIFTGACCWWIILTSVVSAFRHRFNLRLLWWFNKIAGAAIIIFVAIMIILVIIAESTI